MAERAPSVRALPSRSRRRAWPRVTVRCGPSTRARAQYMRIDPASAELTTLTLLPADPPGLTDLVAHPDALYVAGRYDLVRRISVTGKDQARQRLASYPRIWSDCGSDIWVLGKDGGLDRVITTGR